MPNKVSPPKITRWDPGCLPRIVQICVLFIIIILLHDAFRVTTGYDMSRSVCNLLLKIRILWRVSSKCSSKCDDVVVREFRITVVFRRWFFNDWLYARFLVFCQKSKSTRRERMFWSYLRFNHDWYDNWMCFRELNFNVETLLKCIRAYID